MTPDRLLAAKQIFNILLRQIHHVDELQAGAAARTIAACLELIGTTDGDNPADKDLPPVLPQ